MSLENLIDNFSFMLSSISSIFTHTKHWFENYYIFLYNCDWFHWFSFDVYNYFNQKKLGRQIVTSQSRTYLNFPSVKIIFDRITITNVFLKDILKAYIP